VRRILRANLSNVVAIAGLFVIALGVSYFILQNQRLRIPILEPKPFVLNAEFTTGQAVTAGQGQTVRVSGVRVGDIGTVRLVGGHAVVELQLDRDYRKLVHTDATAMLRPKTGLKDMFVDLDPGTPSAPVATDGWTLPLASTQRDINPDEVLASLDGDTRTYLQLLLQGAGHGLAGRGPDLRDVLARFEPTHRDLARINGAVAERRRNLRRLITSLDQLNGALAAQPQQISQLVDASSAVLRQFASEEGSLGTAVQRLPGALSQTTDTLGRVERLARVLRPASRDLRPAARALRGANATVIPFAKEILPVLRSDIRPFVRESRPLVRSLRPAAGRLERATPDLTTSFQKLNRLFNLLAYNPGGAQGPEAGKDRQEGYLFWVAWLDHMAVQLFSNADAHGTLRPTTAGGTCSTMRELVKERPELEFLQGLTPILVGACGGVG
jgi:phospholipid/cholesterol/gamma-HCH transport system substrate-binding protein